jgi:hypothetical protein
LERSRRITRRGITYGQRKSHPSSVPDLNLLPTEGVGLLFQCFQESIARQFAFMQKAWVNAPGFVLPGTGPDPVIGQAEPGGAPVPQQWRKEWGPLPDGSADVQRPFSFGEFVKMRGGEFFFAPSMAFLKALAP